MIYIRIELHPHGDSSRKKLLGEMRIWNTLKGTLTRGAYRFSFCRPNGTQHSGEVTNFPRRSLSAFSLLKRCLNSVETP